MSRRAAIGISVLFVSFGSLFVWHAFARYNSFHNHTFDLAFYARMAWGAAHGSFWDPILNAHFVGLHLSWIMLPLGLLGCVFGTVPVLLVAQVLAVCAAAWPLGLMGARRLGDLGALTVAAAWFLYPNLGHVASDEFHPGTLAVLPMAWAMLYLDAGNRRGLAWAIASMVACRAELSLTAAILGLMALYQGGAMRRLGWRIIGISGVYLLFFLLFLQPVFAPARSSLDLHFGKWGNSVPQIVLTLLTSPGLVIEHLADPKRLFYLPKLLAPLGFLSLLAPRWLLIAAPALAVNLASDFPTNTFMDCHYQTLIVPALAVAAIDGASRLSRWGIARAAAALMCVASLGGNIIAGGLPWSRDYPAEDFQVDEAALTGRKVVSLIPERASVQAPDPLLSHFAERLGLFRSPPPERLADYLVLDVGYRRKYAHSGDLLRTIEEPEVRSWLARSDHAIIYAQNHLVVLQRGLSPREGLIKRYIVGRAPASAGSPVTECLSAMGARLKGNILSLDLAASGPCPSDLAMRIGSAPKPERQDLLFDGLLSPALLAAGDRLMSTHSVTAQERRAILEQGLHIGAVRESGARPNPWNPDSIKVPVTVSN